MPRPGAVISITALLLPHASIQLARGESTSTITYGHLRRRRAFHTSTLDSLQPGPPAPVCFVSPSLSIVGSAKAPWGLLSKRRRAKVLDGRHFQGAHSRSGHRVAACELRCSSQQASAVVIGESTRDYNSIDDADEKGGSMLRLAVGEAGLVTKVIVENLAMVDSVQVEVRGYDLHSVCLAIT